MTRTPLDKAAATATPAATDFINFVKNSDGTVRKATINTLLDTSIEHTIQINSGERVGATAGWVNTGVDTGMMATLPASQSGSTLIVPITGLPIGAIITAFSVRGQIASSGATVTLDADMRKITAVASGHTDSSIGAITQVSVATNTLVASSKTVTSSTVSNTQSYVVKITGTTDTSTDIELNSITVTYTN